MKNKRKAITLSIVAIITLITLIVGATYAYFQVAGDSSKSTNVNVTTYTSDLLTFEIGDDIAVYADQTSFASGKGNATGSTYAKATLVANNKTNEATKTYYMYLDITSNTLEYTQNENTPELLLTITDENGNPVTGITTLSYKTVTDGKDASISGYDITTKTGLITLFDKKEITAKPRKVDTWNVTITLVNLNANQTKNAGRALNAKLILKSNESEENDNTVAICDSGTTLANCIKSQFTGTQGENNIYYHDSILENGAGDNSYRYAGADSHEDYYSCKYNNNEVMNNKGFTDSSMKGDCKKIYAINSFYYDASMVSDSTTVKWDTTLNKCVTLNNEVVYEKTEKEANQTICSGNAYRDALANVYYHESYYKLVGSGEETFATSANTKGVNNFVCLGTDETYCPTDNLYRIIGVFNNKVKVVKAISLGIKSWDENGNNTWSSSSLNTYLNGEYLTSLGSLSKKIAIATWKVGGNTYENIRNANPATAYQNEIINPVTTDTTDNATTYDAKIGLMYASDYGFAASPSAWTTALSSYDQQDSNGNLIKANNYLYLSRYEWLITRAPNVFKFNFSYRIRSSGKVSDADDFKDFVTSKLGIRPSFYLLSSVIYKSGDGTQSSPIRIN